MPENEAYEKERGDRGMCTRNQLNRIMERMKEYYLSIYGTNVVTIVLYGSYARGDFDEESDIDIVAIVKGKRAELQQKLKQIWDLSADLGLENDVVVSPMVIPYDEFMKYKESLPYYRKIEKEGRKIG